jgi:hypothetical protein
VRILVIGGTRFVGPPLVRAFTAAGHDVAVVHRGVTEAELPSVRHIHGDRLGIEAFRPAFRQFWAEVAIDADVYRAFGLLQRIESGAPEPLPVGEDSSLRATGSTTLASATPSPSGSGSSVSRG